jgi:hypothetical protein
MYLVELAYFGAVRKVNKYAGKLTRWRTNRKRTNKEYYHRQFRSDMKILITSNFEIYDYATELPNSIEI